MSHDDVDTQAGFDQRLATLATHEDMRALRDHMTLLWERARLDIHALIDAIELLKYIDSQAP